jgi:hypothetical protein
MKTDQLHQEITTSDFFNLSLGMPDNKAFVIVPEAFVLLQSSLLKTDSHNVLDAARHMCAPPQG